MKEKKAKFLNGYLVKIWTSKDGKRYGKVWNANTNEETIFKVSKNLKA